MNYELMLYQHFNEHIRTETSIEQLALIWQCSSRNAKIKIKQLQQQNKVHWETLRGRGKKPFITLLNSKIEVLKDELKALWEMNKYHEAIELARQMKLLAHPTIQEWLNIQFGLQIHEDKHIFLHPMYYVELCLDPLKALSRHDMHILEQIHETLFSINANGEVIPNLLFSVYTDDYQIWHFILRKDILFHNLQELTATDVIASIQATAPYFKYIFEITELLEIDRYEFRLCLKKACTMLPNYLATTRFAILPANREQMIGCGPFKLIEHNTKRTKLETFHYYFKQRPWIDLVELVYSNDFQSNAIQFKPFEESIAHRKITSQEKGADFVVLNARNGELVNQENRAYVWHLINAEQFIIDSSNECVAYGWIQGGLSVSPKRVSHSANFTKSLIIGYQQIREDVNHLAKAFILQKQLLKHGIHSQLRCVNLQQPQNKLNNEIDIFIGGAALSQNFFPSLINVYSSSPNIILNFLAKENASYVQNSLKTIVEQHGTLDEFQKIEAFIQNTYGVKFLTHQNHSFYIREQTSFKHVQFDQHNRIDYRHIYLSKNNN